MVIISELKCCVGISLIKLKILKYVN